MLRGDSEAKAMSNLEKKSFLGATTNTFLNFVVSPFIIPTQIRRASQYIKKSSEEWSHVQNARNQIDKDLEEVEGLEGWKNLGEFKKPEYKETMTESFAYMSGGVLGTFALSVGTVLGASYLAENPKYAATLFATNALSFLYEKFKVSK